VCERERVYERVCVNACVCVCRETEIQNKNKIFQTHRKLHRNMKNGRGGKNRDMQGSFAGI